MKQVTIARKGGPETLQVMETTLPEPGPGQLRIRVQAAGVNFADVMMRLGLYPDAPKLPAVPGYEVAGVVDAVGEGLDSSWQEKPVLAMCKFGGYSEYVCLDAGLVHLRPQQVSAVQGAALLVNYMTAWQMVRVMAPTAKGDLVLIHSAAGGVGQAVIQLCELSGARVVGSASPSKHDQLRKQGLEFVFDSQRKDFAAAVRAATGGKGVDIALEPRNGPWIMESYEALAKCGRLVVFGFSHAATGSGSGTISALKTLAGVPWLKLNPIRLMNDNKSLAGVNLGRMWDMGHKTRNWVESLLDLLESGKINPVIDSVHPFSRAGEAHQRLENRLNVGKVILVPDGEEVS
jgi:NADPH:quinone reductase-like Zn-dependent oxidoreductase